MEQQINSNIEHICFNDSDFYEKMERSNIIHFSSHFESHSLDLNPMRIIRNEETGTISAKPFHDIRTRSLEPNKISNLNLSNATVLFNACYSSQSNVESMFQDENILHALILAGAKYVLGTILSVDDYDAFRFSSRIYELQIKENIPFREAYHNTCIECINNTIPTYLEFIKEYASKEVYVNALHSSKYNTVDWKPYILWENF